MFREKLCKKFFHIPKSKFKNFEIQNYSVLDMHSRYLLTIRVEKILLLSLKEKATTFLLLFF